MIARLLGVVLVLVPVGMVVALFAYWLNKKLKKDNSRRRRT